MKDLKIITLIGSCLLIAFWVLQYHNNYMEYKVRNCVVLDKIQANGRSDNFYLVVKSEGIVFDVSVRPHEYSQRKVGGNVNVNLRNFDIRQTPKENLIYFFIPSILGAAIIGCFVAILVILIVKWNNL
jgi:hypothetical protein